MHLDVLQSCYEIFDEVLKGSTQDVEVARAFAELLISCFGAAADSDLPLYTCVHSIALLMTWAQKKWVRYRVVVVCR